MGKKAYTRKALQFLTLVKKALRHFVTPWKTTGEAM